MFDRNKIFHHVAHTQQLRKKHQWKVLKSLINVVIVVWPLYDKAYIGYHANN